MAGAGAGAGDRHHRRLDVVVTACSTEEDAAAECRVLRLLNDARVPGVQHLAGVTECAKASSQRRWLSPWPIAGVWVACSRRW